MIHKSVLQNLRGALFHKMKVAGDWGLSSCRKELKSTIKVTVHKSSVALDTVELFVARV